MRLDQELPGDKEESHTHHHSLSECDDSHRCYIPNILEALATESTCVSGEGSLLATLHRASHGGIGITHIN